MSCASTSNMCRVADALIGSVFVIFGAEVPKGLRNVQGNCWVWSCGGAGVSAAVVIMSDILLTGTRATGFVVVPLLRSTVAKL